jgi:hypothetical protein
MSKAAKLRNKRKHQRLGPKATLRYAYGASHSGGNTTDLATVSFGSKVRLRAWALQFPNAGGTVISDAEQTMLGRRFKVWLDNGVRLWVAMSDLELTAYSAKYRPAAHELHPYDRAVQTDDGSVFDATLGANDRL